MTSKQFVFSCAIGAAAALTLGSTASAQQTTPSRDSAATGATTSTRAAASSTRHIRVSKDRGGMSDSGMTSGTSSGMRSSTATTDSATVSTPAVTPTTTPADTTTTSTMSTTPAVTTPADTTTTVTATVPAATTSSTANTMTGRFGNGFYIGLAGGASLPQGTFNDWYKSGWNVTVPFGWQSPSNPLGVRFELGYNRLSGRDFDLGVLGSGSTRDPQIWSGIVDLKADLPLSNSVWRPKLYAVGGGGVHYFRNFTSDFHNNTGTGTGTAFQTELDGSSQTKFGLNGGAGFSFGVGQADLFVEARYTSVFTSGKNTNYVPVMVGITFF